MLVNSKKDLPVSTWEGLQVTFLKTLICKYIISGTEIKKFKELSFLVRCTEIVVFHAKEEDLEIIQTCRRRCRKWILRSALSLLKEYTGGCDILQVGLQGWSGLWQAGSLGLRELALRLGHEGRPGVLECQEPGSQPGCRVGQKPELVVVGLVLAPAGNPGSIVDHLGAFGAGRCQGDLETWVRGSPLGAWCHGSCWGPWRQQLLG